MTHTLIWLKVLFIFVYLNFNFSGKGLKYAALNSVRNIQIEQLDLEIRFRLKHRNKDLVIYIITHWRDVWGNNLALL